MVYLTRYSLLQCYHHGPRSQAKGRCRPRLLTSSQFSRPKHPRMPSTRRAPSDYQSVSRIASSSELPRYHIWSPPTSDIDALTFLFNSVVTFSESQNDSASGWLSELRPLLCETKVDSHLDHATRALSWANMGSMTKQDGVMQRARLAYGKALSSLRRAMSDPIHSRSDETLVSILILGYYEVSLISFTTQWQH